MRRARCIAAAAALGLASLGAGPCNWPPHPAVLVTLDPSVEYQTIDGLGGSAANEFTLRGIPEPARSEVMDLVFGDLDPSVVRIKIWPRIEPVNDDADPEHVNEAGFVPVADQLWQLDELFARSSPKLVAAPWTPPAWMKTNGTECCGGTLLDGMEPEFAELISVYLDTLRDAGHPLDWLSIQNEPESAAPWDANTYSPDRYASVIEAVAQRLLADGHATRLVAPDAALARFVPILLPPTLSRPTAVSLLHAIAFHLYDVHYYEPEFVPAALASVASVAPPGLPLWMTEFSNTTGIDYGGHDEGIAQAELMHAALTSGAGMYVMWNLYRPGGPGEALVVISTTGGADYTITPKYWTGRQYIKYVRPGARRIEASCDDPDVLVSAYRDDVAGNVTAVAINRGAEPRWLLVDGAETELAGMPLVVRTSETESGAELPLDSWERFGPRGVLLPARSVTTLVWVLGDGPPVGT